MRIPKVAWLIVTIVVLCTVLLSIAVYSARHGETYCLFIEQTGNDTFVDLQSGISLSKINSRAFLNSSNTLDESPDGRYIGYLVFNASLPEESALWLYPLRGGLHP